MLPQPFLADVLAQPTATTSSIARIETHMGTHHIAAELGQIAPAVIMPGDPKRATRIAEQLMPDATLVTDVRGMLGYTGTVDGTPLTVMGSGMGMPSATLYATELYRFYDVRRIIRVGTAGGIDPKVQVGDAVVVTGAHTSSNMNQTRLPGYYFAATASFALASAAFAAVRPDDRVHVGTVLTEDYFYPPSPTNLELLAKYGVLAVEMESAGIFAAAAEHGREALTVLTVSDHLLDGSLDMTAEDRETRFQTALRLAVAAAVS